MLKFLIICLIFTQTRSAPTINCVALDQELNKMSIQYAEVDMMGIVGFGLSPINKTCGICENYGFVQRQLCLTQGPCEYLNNILQKYNILIDYIEPKDLSIFPGYEWSLVFLGNISCIPSPS